MTTVNTGKIFLQAVWFPINHQNKIKIDVLRLDTMHEFISGNKWFKLKFHLEHIKDENKTLVTFGGPWSNHLLATAAACKLQGIRAVGIVRGEKPKLPSYVLEKSDEMGMELLYISREDYRKKILPGHLNNKDYHIVPEGGYGSEGMMGAATIRNFFPQDHYTHICCASGTGTTAAGLTQEGKENIIAISVLKNYHTLQSGIEALTGKTTGRLKIFHDYSFGGYADHTPELLQFMNEFYVSSGIPLDFVYTAKLFYAVNDLVLKNYFPPGSQILIIHSGGLKGNLSIGKGTLIF